MQDYHRLDIWQRSMDYAVAVYEWSARLPAEERYGMTAQMRRAVTSVPLNIAEGCGSATRAEFIRFLGYAYRSSKEVVTSLELCQRLYPSLDASPIGVLCEEGNQVGRMIRALIQRLELETRPSTHDS